MDTSALAKASIYDEASRALIELSDLGRLATCLPLMLESGYSARSLEGYRTTIERFYGSWEVLELAPELSEIALGLQSRLFQRGMGRAVGVFDLMVAAHAIHYTRGRTQVIVVHYDSDYEHLERIAPELSASWLLPRGSLPDHAATRRPGPPPTGSSA